MKSQVNVHVTAYIDKFHDLVTSKDSINEIFDNPEGQKYEHYLSLAVSVAKRDAVTRYYMRALTAWSEDGLDVHLDYISESSDNDKPYLKRNQLDKKLVNAIELSVFEWLEDRQPGAIIQKEIELDDKADLQYIVTSKINGENTFHLCSSLEEANKTFDLMKDYHKEFGNSKENVWISLIMKDLNDGWDFRVENDKKGFSNVFSEIDENVPF